MRPTREGRHTPLRAGLVTVGIGVNPDVITEDPEPPDDRASAAEGGQAFIPASVYGTEELLTGKTVTGGGTTIAPGNLSNSNDRNYNTKSIRLSGAEGGTTDWWWAVDLGSPAQVQSVDVDNPIGGGDQFINPTTAFIERSDNGSSWTAESYTYSTSSVPTGLSFPDPATILRHSYVFAGLSAPHRYWRVRKQVGSGFHAGDGMSEWYINGSVVEDVVWIGAPLSIDDSDTTYEQVFEDAIDATGGAFWRGTLADSYLIASFEAEIAFEDAGSVTVLLKAGNEDDYSDAATITTISLTATGSYTADSLAASWSPTAVYRYWQLVLDTTAQGIHVHEVSLLDPPTFTGAHVDLTGRDVADQHPADAVSYDNTTSGLTADDVQAAIDELAATPPGSGIEVAESDGTPDVSDVTRIEFDASGDASVSVVDDGSGQVTVTVGATGGGGGGATGARYPVQRVSGSSSSTNSKAVTIAAATSGNRLIVVTLNESTHAVSSVACTNVTFTKLAQTTAGTAPVIEVWEGNVTGTSGTTVTVTFAGSAFCNAVVTEWTSLSGSLDTSATRHTTTDPTGTHVIPILTPSVQTALVVAAASTISNGTQFSAFSGTFLMIAVTSTLGVAFGFPGTNPVYGTLVGGSSGTASGITVSVT